MNTRARSESNAEQRRRLAAVWRLEKPTDLEISGALRRYRAARRPPPSLPRSALSWALVGALAGAASLLASSSLRHDTPAIGIRAEPTAAPVVAPSHALEPAGSVAEPAPAPHEPAPAERVHPPRRVAPLRAAAPVAPSAVADEPASPADVTRDQDDLARAERWLAVGRGKDAAPILTGLERHGATDAIRKRAAELANGTH
jgi:hypothetical protein